MMQRVKSLYMLLKKGFLLYSYVENVFLNVPEFSSPNY
jgi:hypothetical protein